MVQATDSQVAMWRAAIALAWANGVVDENEKAKLLEFFKDNIYLSDEQRAQLTKDLGQKIELKDVWGQITDPEDRAHLIDIAPTLFSKHGTPTAEEKALYDKMFADQMATVDMQKLKADIGTMKAHIPEEMQELKQEYENDFNNLGAFGRLVYHIDKMLGGEP